MTRRRHALLNSLLKLKIESRDLYDDAVQDFLDTKQSKSVYYRGAFHGEWCTKKAYPKSCQYCEHRVIYWECYHGSKVHFDEDGSGKHWCVEYFLASA